MQISLLDGFVAVGASSLSYLLYVSTSSSASASKTRPADTNEDINKRDRRLNTARRTSNQTEDSLESFSRSSTSFENSAASSHESSNGPTKGYIVINKVTHSRFLPEPSKHAFVYPTLTLFFDIDALDKGDLNLGQSGPLFGNNGTTGSTVDHYRNNNGHAFLFGVGSRSWTRVTNIRPSSYLMDDGVEGRTLRSRLEEFMMRNGLDNLCQQIDDVWLMTSPSYLGYEGINPLSVWYCYGRDKQLLVALLEVHNTFGERHVYILQNGVNEDTNKPKGIDHQWTFPREFHVSPFNDRSGYYTCSLSGVGHPQANPSYSSTAIPLPKIQLNLLTTSKELKLTAIMSAMESQPLTTNSLLRTLAQYPLLLFLSLVRISYHAMILHYEKRLDVYPRPEPVTSSQSGGGIRNWLRHSWNTPQSYQMQSSGMEDHEDGVRIDTPMADGVGWQKEDWLQRAARKRVDKFLRWRVEGLGYQVELIPANPFDQPSTYGINSGVGSPITSTTRRSTLNKLTIYYNTPLFFFHLLVLPSATHALLLGCKVEGIFNVSDEELFLEVFEPLPSTQPSRPQKIRKYFLPSNCPSLPCPPMHFLDQEHIDHKKNHRRPQVENPIDSLSATWNMVSSIGLVVAYYWLEWLEKYLYTLFGARFVAGMEPWNGWGRLRLLKEMMNGNDERERKVGADARTPASIGSVRRE